MKNIISKIFSIKTEEEFNEITLDIFNYQYKNNPIYNQYLNHLGINNNRIDNIQDIPFLPIEFFKTQKIISENKKEEIIFSSSGTTGMQTSKHYLLDLSIYENSFLTAFQNFYGNPEEYVFIGLLPSYLERKGSSLIYMVDKLIEKSKSPESGFYLNQYDEVAKKIIELDKNGKKTMLIGVSYALLDLVEKYKFSLQNTIVLETGGMKGRRKEMIKSDLHKQLKKGFNVNHIHSEYGMTELLSQAYSQKNEKFYCPPWMKILIRDPYDPFSNMPNEKSGGINVIDLANIFSCSFIETKDLGKVYLDNSFEVLGRFDNSDIRGCNLMVE
jgi:phenylacetate-coenzyme A ligase PaaK-like adenylate-forming protein